MAFEYLLGDALTSASASRALAAELPLRSGPVQRAERRSMTRSMDGCARPVLACVCSDGRLALIDGELRLPGRGRLTGAIDCLFVTPSRLAERFAAFSSGAQRRLVRDTFR